MDLIRKNQENRRAQLEFQKMLAQKIRDEPEERGFTDQPLTTFATTGGGRRVIRSGKEMS